MIISFQADLLCILKKQIGTSGVIVINPGVAKDKKLHLLWTAALGGG